MFAFQKEGNPKIHLDRTRVYGGDSTAEIKIGIKNVKSGYCLRILF